MTIPTSGQHYIRGASILLIAMLLAACGSTAAGGPPVLDPGASTHSTPPFDPDAVELELAPLVSGLDAPLFVTSAGDGGDRLFVVEQGGVIRVVAEGVLLDEPFLDITERVTAEGNEQGLLGLVFHPQFETNGQFYVYYTAAGDGANTLARYHADPGSDQADRDSEEILFAIEDPAPNHNGGMLAFGPDGYLYIAMGDGGFGASENAQQRDTLLGKLLRIDVDSGDPYAIPPDNPFVDLPSVEREIWAYGLRNPWRFSFDRASGDLYIADVGETTWEEINVQPSGDDGGANYGWDVMEGMHCHEPEVGCEPERFTLPVTEYDHDQGCSVTGGYVYRGEEYPALDGAYLYGDYCSGAIWSLHRDAGGEWVSTELLNTDLNISSFGEDEAGELYITAHDKGSVYKLEVE